MPSSTDHPEDAGRRRLLARSLRLAAAAALGPCAARAAGAAPASGKTAIPLDKIPPGGHVTRRIGGYPVIVLNRTPALLQTLRSDTAQLADPDSHHSQQPAYAQNPWRSRVPRWLVLVNHCTFDGCRTGAETATPAIFAGFGCPCCGSRYDIAGRVLKSQPAPRNMAVPWYEFAHARREVHITRVPQVRTEHPGASGA